VVSGGYCNPIIGLLGVSKLIGRSFTYRILPQNRDYTEARLLGFSYDFGVTVIRHENADAMVHKRTD
jgi:hypothetical protein